MNGDLNSWDKFCNYLWFDKKLNIWLDISKINFTSKEIINLEDKFDMILQRSWCLEYIIIYITYVYYHWKMIFF